MGDIVDRLRERAAFDRAAYAENERNSEVVRLMHNRRLALARDLEEAASEIEALRAGLK